MKSVFRMRREGTSISGARCSCGSVKTAFAVSARSLFLWLNAPLSTLKVGLLDEKTSASLMSAVNLSTRFVINGAIPRKAAAIFSRLFLAASILLLNSSTISFAQAGVPISGQAITPGGTPAAGAQITVCPYTASGIPCSPQSLAYSNPNLTGLPLPWPYSADQYGNYLVWVAPGSTYMVQVAVNQTVNFTYFYSSSSAFSGSGTANVLTKWTSLNSLGNSAITEASGTATASENLSVAATTPATSSTAVASPSSSICGNVWNGSISIPLCAVFSVGYTTSGGFTNPPPTLSIGTGSSTSLGVNFSGVLQATSNNGVADVSGNGFFADSSIAATSGANVTSPPYQWAANFWNGTQSTNSIALWKNVPGTGTNPSVVWKLSYSGANAIPDTTGVHSVDMSAAAFVDVNAIVAAGAKFVISSGCTTSATAGGAMAGTFTASSSTCSPVITPGITAPNGFACSVTDMTTGSATIRETAYSATTVTFTGGTLGSTDQFIFNCTAF